MAYLIFSKREILKENDLYRIAETEEHLNGLNILKNDYIIKTISDEDFNNLKSESKKIESINGDQITYVDFIKTKPLEKQEFDKILENKKEFCQDILNRKQNKPVILELVQQYLTALNNIDTSTISFPLDKNFTQYLHSQSIFCIHPLQID
jgi:hypothetical protein